MNQEQAEQPIINLHGDLVALGPRQRDHIPLFLRWINDFAVTHSYGMRFRNRTWEAMQANYEQGSKGGPDFVDFTIYERATLRPIGWTALEEIDHFDRTAKYIILIGEQRCWGQGYGTETTCLMLDYGFTGLGLHNIYLTVFSFNGLQRLSPPVSGVVGARKPILPRYARMMVTWTIWRRRL
ncbi:MAG: GNAT family protein [Caldilineaceae bacterium]